MEKALELAICAERSGEVPVGAIVVDKDGNIISRAYNLRETQKSAVAHAEIIAVQNACEVLGGWRLSGCTLYVTLEPCPMCAGALAWSQIGRIVYGAPDAKRGFSTIANNILHPRTVVTSEVLREECERLMTDFFAKLR